MEQDFTCRIARYTFVGGFLDDAKGRVRRRAVAEYQAHTSPRMRVRNFNIAGVAWSNVKLGININRRIAIINFIPSIDVVKVGAGVDEALVELKGTGGRERRETLRAWGAVFGGADGGRRLQRVMAEAWRTFPSQSRWRRPACSAAARSPATPQPPKH